MRDDIIARKEEILQWIKEEKSKSFICRELKCKQDTLNRYLYQWGITYKGRQDWCKGQPAQNYKTAEEYIKNDYPHSHILLQKMIRDGLKEARCEICNNTEWQGKPIPLELHHKDGDHFNNSFDNLQICCPNCHALQPYHAGKNWGRYKGKDIIKKETNKCKVCGKEIESRSTYCSDCYHIVERLADRPSREELKKLIREKPFTQIGRMFGVSDNSIRKWCDNYDLPRRATDIKAMSDEEWEKI